MNKISATLCLSAFLAASVGICGDAMAQAETPRRGGTLVFAITNGEPPTYDCHANSTTSTLYRAAPHYSTLIKISQTEYPKIVGDAAESWKASADGLSYEFRLHPNIRFHDGSILTSADVKATFDRIRKPSAGVVSARQSYFRDIESIDTPDDRTAIFRLSKPNAAMWTILAGPGNCLYSAKKLEEDPRFPARNVMGTGPFRFVRHVAGSEWIGERLEGYFRQGRPYLDGFRILNMAIPAATNAMIASQIMTDFRGVTLQDRDRIVAARGEKVKAGDTVQIFIATLTMNTQRKPFDDARVRKALNIAIDRWTGSRVLQRQFVLSSMGGGYTRIGSPLGPTKDELEKMTGFRPDMAANRAEARRLLAEAGQSDLKFTAIVRPEYTPLGIFLIDQWRQIGVTVAQDQPENVRYFTSLNNGNFEVIIDATQDYADDPLLQFANTTSYDINPFNPSRAIDRKTDELYERQARALDLAERRRIVRELEGHVMEQSYRVPLFWSQRYTVMATELRGYDLNTPSNLVGQDLADLWLAQ
jgi:peptide/nickel transport system substrate-binding protein